MTSAQQRVTLTFLALVLLLIGPGAPTSCTGTGDPEPPAPLAVAECIEQTPGHLTAPRLDPAAKTITPGTIPASFSVTSTGEAKLEMRLTSVPGRGVEPDLSLVYDSAA